MICIVHIEGSKLSQRHDWETPSLPYLLNIFNLTSLLSHVVAQFGC